MTRATSAEHDGGSTDRGAKICREAGDAAFVVAIAMLPGMGPATLRRLLSVAPGPECWRRILAGTVETMLGSGGRLQARRDLHEQWRASAERCDPAAAARAVAESGVVTHVLGDTDYPGLLAEEPTAPTVCFTLGTRRQLDTGDPPRVALVGTRYATHYGEEIAAGLGCDLAAAGVSIVSGLAAGIDASAHEGALVHADSVAPVAFVGGGVDVVYPASNRRLRERLVREGTLVSEAPPGAPPEPWRFPLRNRLVAAAVDLVVVVEAHATGGALQTVEAALARGIPVAVVPGSVRSAASRGTNALIADGASVVRDVDDALAIVALRRASARASRPSTSARVSRRPDPIQTSSSEARRVHPAFVRGSAEERAIAVIGDGPTSLEAVVQRTAWDVGKACVTLDRLVHDGHLVRCLGGYELAVPAPRSSGDEQVAPPATSFRGSTSS